MDAGLTLAVILIGGAILGCAVFLAVYGIPSRRPLVAIFLAIAWGAWYRQHLKANIVKLIVWAIPVAIVAMILVGMWTHARGAIFRGESPMQAIKQLANISKMQGFNTVLEGSLDAQTTMWALDAYPDRHEVRTLFAFQYMVYHPIPRSYWPEKPIPITRQVSRLAKLKGVNHSKITLTPCVIGAAAAEGGMIALVLYGLFFGQYMRFFDEIISQNPTNPFLILAAGCTLGHVIGLPRGDLSIFTNLIMEAFLSTWFIMLVLRMFVGRVQKQFASATSGVPQQHMGSAGERHPIPHRP